MDPGPQGNAYGHPRAVAAFARWSGVAFTEGELKSSSGCTGVGRAPVASPSTAGRKQPQALTLERIRQSLAANEMLLHPIGWDGCKRKRIRLIIQRT